MPAAAPKGEEPEIAFHRTAIDALDRAILESLNARAKHAKAIGQLKEGSAAYRPEREAQVLARLAAANAGPLSDAAVTGVFREIMSACLALEQKLRIAYLGPAGTFSHAAVAKHFGSFVDTTPLSTIDEIFRAVESGQTDYAVVPVENSTEGAVGQRSISCAHRPVRLQRSQVASSRIFCRTRARCP
jgi:chorismate mutase/prephenate dehydratase